MSKVDIVRALFNGMRLRTNVIIVAVLVTWIIIDFGDKMIGLLENAQVPHTAIVAVISMLIGTGVGGLIIAMMEMFKSPQVPADTHERIVDALLTRIPRNDD